ncbi:hypothetical protein EII17_10395 [Clostridiales bacterium COT073_COT-073]|nr:hypothetical protein EII17_10395 [Clostridiales bacterium COT073_COT-073]
MKYRIRDFKVDFRLTEDEWLAGLEKKLSGQKLLSCKILRKSVDARKNLLFVYHLLIETNGRLSPQELNKLNGEVYTPEKYQLPCSYETGQQLDQSGNLRPLVIGSGPAGLFAGLILAECGLKPIIFERGEAVEKRAQSIARYNQTGELNTESNIQFGEGGAGTFSDGKLNTGVKDAGGRRSKVLETFVEAGARENILYDAKPHIGTDYLIQVVANMRKKIERLGGEIRFESRMDEIITENGKIKGIMVKGERIPAEIVILAIGHSARDSFKMLLTKQIVMESKPFAVGLRVEHKQSLIDQNQYGRYAGHPHLPAAEYKLTYQAENGRRVYSFCMCPGGRVVNSASEKGRLVCNGMSYEARDLDNANSAILIGIDEKDYGAGILAGMEYQRQLEEKAFCLGGSNYAMPVERYGDFKSGCKAGFRPSKGIESSLECKISYANLRSLFTEDMNQALVEAMQNFGRKIKGFDDEEALLTGVESRSSSPVRILRDGDYQSLNCQGLYPCGEGAGYAGGIMSAALDGIKVAEKIIESLIRKKE